MMMQRQAVHLNPHNVRKALAVPSEPVR